VVTRSLDKPLATQSAQFLVYLGEGEFCLLCNLWAGDRPDRWQQQRQADLMCLARNVYHEARGEPTAGQHAVAEVTLNRVASRQFPATVCEVVYEKRFDVKRNRLVGAFSWTEFDWVSKPKGIAWERAVRSAEAVYDKQQDPTVKGALFYHADSIEPRWAKEKNQVAKIGSHIFYE
jgi:spore germination cell wall hydrolase CwlJ-like protein